MRSCMERAHFEQAKLWLEAAKYTASGANAQNKYAVAIAMLIHAITKANDALTLKFLNTTAHRHDDARRLFEDLIKKNLIKAEFASYKQIIQDAISNKAKAEYRGTSFSKAEYDQMQRKAEKFVKLVEEILG